MTKDNPLGSIKTSSGDTNLTKTNRNLSKKLRDFKGTRTLSKLGFIIRNEKETGAGVCYKQNEAVK